MIKVCIPFSVGECLCYCNISTIEDKSLSHLIKAQKIRHPSVLITLLLYHHVPHPPPPGGGAGNQYHAGRGMVQLCFWHIRSYSYIISFRQYMLNIFDSVISPQPLDVPGQKLTQKEFSICFAAMSTYTHTPIFILTMYGFC